MGGLGPMSGQRGHFAQHAPQPANAYGLERYANETNRLHGVLDRQLAGRDYIAGDYSIADMACYPWCVSAKRYGTDYAAFANVRAWMDRMAARPAVKKAYEIGKQFEGQRATDDEAKKILYGQTADERGGDEQAVAATVRPRGGEATHAARFTGMAFTIGQQVDKVGGPA